MIRSTAGYPGQNGRGASRTVGRAGGCRYSNFRMKFSELVRLLEANGFRPVKEKGSIRYYGKLDHPNLVRVDFHGTKEVPTGTCHAILKSAGIRKR